jgi:fumarate hydratase subunit alpha
VLNEISVSKITDAVERLCILANKQLPCDIVSRIEEAAKSETDPLACSLLSDIKRNIDVADKTNLPICQDTGMAVVFLKVGQDVHFTGGSLVEAVNEGVRRGYEKGLLRKSIVADPLNRVNTGDNTPAVIHTEIVEGDSVEITVAPKGFGSENMSGIRMLTPFDGRQGVVDAVLEIVKTASNNPCPPMVVGVGIGGDFEQCALLSKKALCRSTDKRNENKYYAALEQELLEKINKLNIGPQGFGGITTALAVNIETAATHIAGLPVAVNIGCHVTRHASCEVR